jgi:hypothetical protein
MEARIDRTCTRPRCERVCPIRDAIWDVLVKPTHTAEVVCLLSVLASAQAQAMACLVFRRPAADRWLTPAEAANYTSLSQRWLIEHAHEIPAAVWPNTRQPRFSQRGLNDWMREHRRR